MGRLTDTEGIGLGPFDRIYSDDARTSASEQVQFLHVLGHVATREVRAPLRPDSGIGRQFHGYLEREARPILGHEWPDQSLRVRDPVRVLAQREKTSACEPPQNVTGKTSGHEVSAIVGDGIHDQAAFGDPLGDTSPVRGETRRAVASVHNQSGIMSTVSTISKFSSLAVSTNSTPAGIWFTGTSS